MRRLPRWFQIAVYWFGKQYWRMTVRMTVRIATARANRSIRRLSRAAGTLCISCLGPRNARRKRRDAITHVAADSVTSILMLVFGYAAFPDHKLAVWIVWGVCWCALRGFISGFVAAARRDGVDMRTAMTKLWAWLSRGRTLLEQNFTGRGWAARVALEWRIGAAWIGITAGRETRMLGTFGAERSILDAIHTSEVTTEVWVCIVPLLPIHWTFKRSTPMQRPVEHFNCRCTDLIWLNTPDDRVRPEHA